MENHIFRGALGGFNRQDVTAYIERTQAESAARVEALETQIKTLEETAAAAQASLETAQAERAELERQLTDMTLRYNHAKNNWDAQAAAKESFRADVVQRDATVKELTGENQRLFHRVEDLEKQVAAFRQEKERVAQLELEARQRAAAVTSQADSQAAQTAARAKGEAQAIVAEAQAQAQVLLRETEEQVQGTVDQYAALFDSFDTIAGHITNELRKMDVTVSQLPLNFNHLRDSLQALLERARER